MKLSDFPAAHALSERIARLQDAADRLGSGAFKQAVLVVDDHAHGQPGLEGGRPQVSQSRVDLDRETAFAFVRDQLAEARRRMRDEFGVSE